MATTARAERATRSWLERLPVAPATVALAGVILVAAVVLLYASRHLTFYFDEWDFIQARRGGSVGTYLDPHNAHLVLFSVLVYKLLFVIVGLHHYWPYQAVLVVLHLLCCGLLYALIRPRLGAWLALAPVTLLLFIGTAFQDLLWPFQMALLVPVAGGLGALLLIQRGTHRADACASALLILCLSGSGAGVPFVLGTGGVLIYQRSNWRRFWVVMLPLALFVVWYLGWGSSEHITSDSVLGTPQYIADAAAFAVAGLAGLSPSWGAPLAVVALAGCIVASWPFRERRFALLAGAGAGALSFWALAAVARADYVDPGASRYLYIGAVFLILIGAECLAGRVIGTGAAIAATLVLLFFLVGNLNALRNGERTLRASDTSVKEALAATDIAAPVVDRDFKPDPVHAPQITAGPYLAAARDLGTPALTVSQLATTSERGREHADQVLLQAEAVGLVPVKHATAAKPPAVEAVTGGHLIAAGRCDLVAASAPPVSVEAVAPPGGALSLDQVRPPGVSVYVRRFGANFPGPTASVLAGASSSLAFPVDAAPNHSWTVQLVARASFRICAR